MIVDELIGVLGWETTGDADLKRFKENMRSAEKGLEEFAKRAGQFAVAITVAVGAGMAALGKSVVNVSAQFESYAATLETIEGSSEKANKSLDWIADFAKKTPYDVAELTEAFVKLRAYGMDPTTGLLEDLGNASSAMGKDLMSAVEMIADASTGEFERLKEFGIRASQEGKKVTFSWTENGKQLSKTVNKTSDEITTFIRDRFGSRFRGAMVRQADTWNGMISNLGDTWTDFQRRIGDAGFFEAVKGQLGRAMDYIDGLDADGTLDKWAKGLSNGLTWAVDTVGNTIGRLRGHFEYISKWVESNSGIWDKIKVGLMAIAAIVFPKGAAILVLEDVLTFLQGGDSLIGRFAQSLSELTGIDADSIGAVFAAIAAGGAGLVLAIGPIRAATSALKSLSKALGEVNGSKTAPGVKDLGNKAGNGASGWLSSLGVWGGAAGGLWSLADPGEGLKNAPRSKWGVDDVIRSLFGTDGGAGEGAGKYSAEASAAKADSARHNVFQAMEDRLTNAKGHLSNMATPAAAANAVLNDNKQDNRNQSVKVEVGGVTVQGVQNVSATVGGAVGRAVGQAAVPRVSRFERDDAF